MSGVGWGVRGGGVLRVRGAEQLKVLASDGNVQPEIEANTQFTNIGCIGETQQHGGHMGKVKGRGLSVS